MSMIRRLMGSVLGLAAMACLGCQDNQKMASDSSTSAHVTVADNTFDDRTKLEIHNIVKGGDLIAVKDLSMSSPSTDNFTINVPIGSIISEISMAAGSPTATLNSLAGSDSGMMPMTIPKTMNISSNTVLTNIGTVTMQHNITGKDVIIIINNEVQGGALNEHLSSKIVRLGDSKDVGGLIMDKNNVFDSLDSCTSAAKAATATTGEPQVVVKATSCDPSANKASTDTSKSSTDSITSKATDCFVFVGKSLFPSWASKLGNLAK